MTTRNQFRKAAPFALLAAVAALTTLGASTATRAQAPQDLERQRALEKAVQAQLDESPGREFYVVTDKPLYHPGESVWFRAWELETRGFAATQGEHGVTFTLLDPRGGKVAEKRVKSASGMATNDFQLGADLAGGPYTLRAQSDLGPKLERTVTVSTYEVPRLKKSVELTRSSYGPGENVVAKVTAFKGTGEPLAGARVSAVVTVDGNEIARFFVPIDPKGEGTVRFQLPPHMARGDVTLTLTVDGGGVSETIQKRVPVVLADVDVEVFPEGGDLVSGLASRVYLAGRDKLGKPAEIEGRVVDEAGREVATFKSLHDGLARFSLTPQPGKSYQIKLSKPAGNAQAFPLPQAKAAGCVIASDDDFASKSPELRARVACTEAKRVVATAVLRGKLLGSALVEAPSGGQPASFSLPSEGQGAVRLTVFDDQQRPLAERLVYRGRGRDAKISITADRQAYGPRDKVTLRVKSTDEGGRPVPADLALAVVDDQVLQMADSKPAGILASLYLEPEMPGQTINEPGFYFSSDKRAPEAMDLLMGTKGHRRFVWKWVK